MEQELRKIMGCTCLRMRRATRRITQLYDHALGIVGLTVNQFGLLAYLQGATLAGAHGLSISSVADFLGMDPTTLNRNLKPLAAKGLVMSAADQADRRVRKVQITNKGKRILLGALPLWREAQAQVEKALGPKETAALNGLLDLSAAKLRQITP
jgi:DNA-binding MarR family transcriptional regulator